MASDLPPKTSVVEAGKPFELSVNITNALSVLWLLNGDEVGEEHQMKQDGDKYTLVIPSMKSSLAGSYAVEAISPTGQVLKEQFEVTCKGLK